MKIAVLSDTHDRVPPGLPARLGDADEIWHLGDVCHPVTLLALEALGKPLRVISGNCDTLNLWPGVLRRTVHGVRFHLEHVAPRKAPPDTDVILSGHTHVPGRRTDGAVTWLNPGCLTRPNRGAPPSYAWLEVQADGSWRWTLELV